MALSKADLISIIREKLASGIVIPAKNHREVEEAIVENVFNLIDETNYNGAVIGDIKEIACDQGYISTNFESSTSANDGRGKLTGERYGWAICNGNQNNGPILDKRGRVSVGVGNAPYTIGATGGAATHTLILNEMPIHHHHTDNSIFKSFVALASDYANNSSQGVGGDNNANQYELAIGNLGTNYLGGGAALEQDRGGSQSHNNMQPYIVSLFIQKIATPYI